VQLTVIRNTLEAATGEWIGAVQCTDWKSFIQSSLDWLLQLIDRLSTDLTSASRDPAPRVTLYTVSQPWP